MKTILAAILFCLFIGFTACTQGKDSEEVGKGVTQEIAGDSCEGAQAENVLCKWVVPKMVVMSEPPPPNPDMVVTWDFNFDDQGRITKLDKMLASGNQTAQMGVVALTYNSQGLLESSTTHTPGQSRSYVTHYDYNSEGKITQRTFTSHESDASNPFFADYPKTDITLYDYQPPPPHHLVMTQTGTDAQGKALQGFEEKFIMNPDGTQHSHERMGLDSLGNVLAWQFTENTYREGKYNNVLSKSQPCTPQRPCTQQMLQHGPDAMNPNHAIKSHFEHDEEGHPVYQKLELFDSSSGPLGTTPYSVTECQFLYDLDTEAPLAHEHPIRYADTWAVTPGGTDFMTSRDITTGVECEVSITGLNNIPVKTKLKVEFTLKRLYEVLGVAKPD